MNELLQRRLVGALVLFAVAFVLASLLPDAQTPVQPEGVQVVTFDLNAAQTPDESSAPGAPAAPPAGAVVTPRPPRTAVQLQESLSLSSPQSTAQGAAQSWYVQIGSFESQANARSVQTRLHQLDSPVSIQPVQVGKTLWYRVRVGPYPAEAAAQKALAAIRKKGFNSARLVRPDSP